MKALIAFLLAFAWSANAAISTATKPHTIDSAATPKVSYVDDNDEALLDKINELIDTTNLHNSSGAVVGDLFSSTGDMRLLIDSDNNGTNRWMVTANGATDTLWRILESGAWKGFGDGYVSGKVVASDSLVGATLRATGNLSAGGTLAVTGASTIAALSATTGSFSSTLGVTGASTLAALSATTGSFSSTLTSTGKFTGSDTVAALLGFRAGSAGATDVSLYRSGSDTWYTPDTLQVGGKIIAELRVRAGTSMPTYSTKRFTAIGNSFDNTAVQMENTDVGTMAQGRAYNWGITDVSATEGRLDLTIPSVLTALSVFYNGNVGIGSTTDGGQVFQVTGTSRFTGTMTAAAANFSGAVSTGALTATTVTTGGGESFVYGDTSFTLTATGMTTSPTGTAYGSKIGNIVTLYVPSISGTSNATTFTLTGIPTGWRPTRTQYCVTGQVQDNGTTEYSSSAYINTSGVIDFGRSNGSAWTSSGTKSNNIVTITYILQ